MWGSKQTFSISSWFCKNMAAILVSDFAEILKIFSKQVESRNDFSLSTNAVNEVHYKDSSFCHDTAKNMAAMGNFCFWLA